MDQVVSAFSIEATSRLTGVTVSRLRRWDRTGFFAPSLGSANRREAFSRIYTFHDLLELQVIHTLLEEHQVPLRHLRKVHERLDGMPEEGWSRTTLYVLNRKVLFHERETAKPREIASGQYVLELPLEVVRRNMQRAVEDMATRDTDEIGKFSRSRWVAQNREVIKGTRIPTSTIRSFIEAGYDDEQIVAQFPTLEPADIAAVRKSAA